jgi:dTDP-glucose 4,6-dehydratase
VLVTGGLGFIGSNFVRSSLATRPGISITVLDAMTYAGRLSNLEGLDGQYSFVHGDIRDSQLVDSLVSQSDLVVHFAAESHNDNSLHSPDSFITTNINGTFNLIQAAAKHRVRFHHVSTDEVFGDLALDAAERFNEQTPYNPSSPYSASKAASDHLVRAWVRSFGLKATISNCSNNFGPYQHEEKFIPRTVLLALSGIKPKIYGKGENVRDWISVEDHSDGVWAVIDRGQIGETYLLGADNERNNLQVVAAILEHLNLPADFFELVVDRPGHDLRYAIDATRARTELSWTPKQGDFEAQLGPVIEFYRSRSKDFTPNTNSGLSNTVQL